jgi:hypothetical protein
MSDELASTIIVTKAHYLFLSMFANISYIPLSFKDEKLEVFELEVLELSPIELEPWFENEAMISK